MSAYTNTREPGEFGEGVTVEQVRQFPIKHDDVIKSIPWDVLKPHEVQALRNHKQGLDRLAEHGGLTPCEALAVIEGRPWDRMAFTDARKRLADYVRGAVANEEQATAFEAASSPDALNLEDLRAALRLVDDFRRGTAHPTRWQLNRLTATLERVKGRIEGAVK